MRLSHPFQVLSVLALCLLAVGCAPQAQVERRRPAAYNAGSSRTLALVQLTGKPDLQELLSTTLRREASRSDWWSYRDATDNAIALFPGAGPGRTVRGPAPAVGEVYVRLDAYDATVFPAKRNEAGQRVSDLGRLRVRFSATVIDDAGEPLMNEETFEGLADGPIDSRLKRKRLIREAAENGIENFLGRITPERVRERITLDDESEDMRPVGEQVRQGRYALALDELRAMRQRNPRRPDIVYNMAVLTDARGDYAEALELYDEALRLGYKPVYARSREACLQRLRERERLAR